MAIEITIFCDACGAQDEHVGTATNALERHKSGVRPHLVRAALQADGWICGLPGGRDLCPDCQTPERVREARKPPKAREA